MRPPDSPELNRGPDSGRGFGDSCRGAGTTPDPLAGRLPDGDAFWAAVEERRDAVARALYARYPLTPRSYVAGTS